MRARFSQADVPVVLAGDFNVVPTDFDIYPTTSYAKNALVQPESRASFRRLLDQGWIDAIRKLHPDAPMFTFWDYMRNRWPRDAGLRLDHLLLSKSGRAPIWSMPASIATSRGRTAPATMRRPGSCCATRPCAAISRAASPGPESQGRTQGRAQGEGSRANKREEGATETAVAGHRRRLVRASRLSRAAEDHHAPRRQAAGAIVGFANMLLRFYEAEKPARRAGRVGYA